MESEQSQVMPCANGRTKKASGIISLSTKFHQSEGQWCKFHSESKNPGIRRSYVQGQGKMDVSVWAEKPHSSCLHVFVLFRPPMDWMMSISIDEGDILYSVYYSNANLFWSHPHGYTQKYYFTSHLDIP